MKKASIIFLIACMLLGSLTLSASAATYEFKADTYVTLINPNGDFIAGNLKQVRTGTDFNIPVTAEAKDDVVLSAATKRIDASNVDSLVRFKKTGTATTISFKSELSKYFRITSSAFSGDENRNVIINFEEKNPENIATVYRVDTAISTDDYSADVSANIENPGSGNTARKYILTPGSITAIVSKWHSVICSIDVGSRLYSAGGEHDMKDIASIHADIERNNGTMMTYEYSSDNTIAGLATGERVTLTARLLNKEDAAYYKFNGWVDGNGNMISTSNAITYYVDDHSHSLFATYVQVKPHVVLNTETLKMTYKQVVQLQAFPDAVHWESSNPKAVRVDSESGLIEAVGAGKATITAFSADGASATCEVTARYTFIQLLIRIFLFGWIWD